MCVCVCVCIIISLSGKISEKLNKVGSFLLMWSKESSLQHLSQFSDTTVLVPLVGVSAGNPEGVSRTDFGSGGQDPLSGSHGHWSNGVPHSCEKLSFFCWLADDGSSSQFWGISSTDRFLQGPEHRGHSHTQPPPSSSPGGSLSLLRWSLVQINVINGGTTLSPSTIFYWPEVIDR